MTLSETRKDMSMPLLTRLQRDGLVPETSRPDPARLISGDPVHTTWNLEDRDGLYCGLWQSTPGAWRVIYSEWEYCHILAGHSVLTEDGGEPAHLRAGDSIVIRPGFAGVWEVVETTLKDYVIRL
jgi:uncharacterized cupin superfamily protein